MTSLRRELEVISTTGVLPILASFCPNWVTNALKGVIQGPWHYSALWNPRVDTKCNKTMGWPRDVAITIGSHLNISDMLSPH